MEGAEQSAPFLQLEAPYFHVCARSDAFLLIFHLPALPLYSLQALSNGA